MKLTFQTYILVSLVTLVHVILVAAALPSRHTISVSASVPGFHIDEEGMVWLGPSGFDGADVTAAPPASEAEGSAQEASGSGIETSTNSFAEEPALPLTSSEGSGSLSRRPADVPALESLSISESAELTREAEASPRIEMEALPRPGSPRPLRPLHPSSVN